MRILQVSDCQGGGCGIFRMLGCHVESESVHVDSSEHAERKGVIVTSVGRFHRLRSLSAETQALRLTIQQVMICRIFRAPAHCPFTRRPSIRGCVTVRTRVETPVKMILFSRASGDVRAVPLREEATRVSDHTTWGEDAGKLILMDELGGVKLYGVHAVTPLDIVRNMRYLIKGNTDSTGRVVVDGLRTIENSIQITTIVQRLFQYSSSYGATGARQLDPTLLNKITPAILNWTRDHFATSLVFKDMCHVSWIQLGRPDTMGAPTGEVALRTKSLYDAKVYRTMMDAVVIPEKLRYWGGKDETQKDVMKAIERLFVLCDCDLPDAKIRVCLSHAHDYAKKLNAKFCLTSPAILLKKMKSHLVPLRGAIMSLTMLTQLALMKRDGSVSDAELRATIVRLMTRLPMPLQELVYAQVGQIEFHRDPLSDTSLKAMQEVRYSIMLNFGQAFQHGTSKIR